MNTRHMLALGSGGTLLIVAACAGNNLAPVDTDAELDGGSVVMDVDAPDASEDVSTDGGDAGDAADASDADTRCTVDWCDTPLPIPDGGKMTLMDVWVPAENQAWAVSEEGLVLRWNGTQWSVVWNAETPLYGIWGDHEGAVWVVGAAGSIFYGPGGKDWTRIPSGVTTDLMGICEGTRDAEHPRNISIVGAASKVLRWTGARDEGGAPSWDTSTLGVKDTLYSIACRGLDVWVSGTDGASVGGRVYLNSGAGFVAQSAVSGGTNFGMYETFSSVWAHDQANIWARGKFAIVWSAPGPDGSTREWSSEWSMLVPGNVKRSSGIWGTSAADVWIVSTRGRIHHWDGKSLVVTVTAKGWDVLDSNLHAVSGSGPNDVWVVGDNVALHRNNRRDGGEK
jgi:hypothetical protein